VAALVLGIIGGSVLAIIFGLIARNQIRKSEGRQRGLGMATVGLILGGVWIVVVAIILATHKTPTPPAPNSNSNNNNTNTSGMPPVGNRSPLYDVADVITPPSSGSNIWFYPAVRATAVVS